MHWLKLELKLLFSGVAAKLCLSLILICSIGAIYLGKASYNQLEKAHTTNQALFEQQLAAFEQREQLPSAGHMGYYAFAPTQWKLSPWAALFVGQSQTAYAAMPIRALALQGQIYNREMVNPSWQKAGRLDLGFVLIYLLPMMLGILSVTLLSEERSANRWRMLSAMNYGGSALIWRRLILTTAVVLVLGWLILLASAIWLSLPFDSTILWLMCALAVYLCFWAILIAIVISFAKGSVFNTLCFIFVWLALCVLIPATIKLYLDNQAQQHPALNATLEQRIVMNNGWDEDNKALFKSFTQRYPQYKDAKLPQGAGSWEWYYAQQHMSDEAVSEYWQAYTNQQQQRHQLLDRLSILSPSLMMQLAVDRIAGSSAQQQFEYQLQVADYHQQIREYLYQYLFSDKQITQSVISAYPKFSIEKSAPNLPFEKLLTLLLLMTLIMYGIYRQGQKLPQV